MYSPRLVKEVMNTLGKQLVDDGRLSRVGHTRMARRRLRSARKSARPSQSQGRKKREEIDWVLKQKLFDYVPESECAERQGRPCSLKWVLKNKGEKVRARLDVREIKRAKSEDEKLEPSDVFSAMPPLESLKLLVSHVMTERVDKRGRNLVLAVFDVSRAHFYGVCDVMFTWFRPQFVLEPNSTKRCTGRKMRALPGRNCGVKTSAAMALSWVQAIQRCTDQSL